MFIERCRAYPRPPEGRAVYLSTRDRAEGYRTTVRNLGSGRKKDDQAQHAEPTTVSIPLWLAWLAAVGWRVLAILGLLVVSAWIAFTIGTVTASVAVAAVAAAALMPAVRSPRARGLGANTAVAVGTVAVFRTIVGLLGLVAVDLVTDGAAGMANVSIQDP